MIIYYKIFAPDLIIVALRIIIITECSELLSVGVYHNASINDLIR